ncbi:hypothetical protein DPMN_082740 [Dreissena polymorpha]|uniref:Uncharacterized protein n=1 Tax=Dreissena polymorpha TaxID=45954 RepID=A0A9D3Y7I4_DREPO|nr:hypothetical protein DPMN_082740 [Dreissena polymorpha]
MSNKDRGLCNRRFRTCMLWSTNSVHVRQVCVCVCVRACVRARVRVCGGGLSEMRPTTALCMCVCGGGRSEMRVYQPLR